MNNNSTMLQLCRLCLVKDNVNIPIFEGQGDISQIFQKISSCLPVKVTREDKLPQKICDGCSYKLDIVNDFRNTTVNAEKQLLTWLSDATSGSAAAAVAVTRQVETDVAQQIKPAETFVKQEAIDPSDVSKEEDDVKSYMFQDKFELPAESKTSENEDEPPPKRAKRTAAVKAAIALDNDSDEDDDDSGEPLTKVEDESDEGSDEDHSFVDIPSTSADDQPGPSGVNKDGGEAPLQVKSQGNAKSLTKANTSKPKRERKPKNSVPRKPRRTFTAHPPPIKLEEPIHCDVCSDAYYNHVDLALHSIKHSEDGKYSCHICSTYRNAKKYTIEMHVRAHEGSTKYKCEICQKAFTISTHATEHKYFHSGEKPFQCEICGKHFMFSRQLASHRRTSHYEILTGSPLVKFDCDICKKHYESAFGLRRHKMTIHNNVDLSVICDICGKRISSREKLKFHMRTHTGDKPYPCEICGKCFSKKYQMIEHTRTHTGEKPYKCTYCGRGFTQRTPLVLHVRTHTGERPNICRLCGNGFISKTSLESHMKNCLLLFTT